MKVCTISQHRGLRPREGLKVCSTPAPTYMQHMCTACPTLRQRPRKHRWNWLKRLNTVSKAQELRCKISQRSVLCCSCARWGLPRCVDCAVQSELNFLSLPRSVYENSERNALQCINVTTLHLLDGSFVLSFRAATPHLRRYVQLWLQRGLYAALQHSNGYR